jgi:hypothetical protein
MRAGKSYIHPNLLWTLRYDAGPCLTIPVVSGEPLVARGSQALSSPRMDWAWISGFRYFGLLTPRSACPRPAHEALQARPQLAAACALDARRAWLHGRRVAGLRCWAAGPLHILCRLLGNCRACTAPFAGARLSTGTASRRSSAARATAIVSLRPRWVASDDLTRRDAISRHDSAEATMAPTRQRQAAAVVLPPSAPTAPIQPPPRASCSKREGGRHVSSCSAAFPDLTVQFARTSATGVCFLLRADHACLSHKAANDMQRHPNKLCARCFQKYQLLSRSPHH